MLILLFQMVLILNVYFVMEQKSDLNVSIMVSQCVLLIKKPLHELCRYWLLRFLVPNVDLVSNGSDAEFFSAMKSEEPFECFNWVSHMCFVDNKPLPGFCWKFPLRILFATVVLVSNCFNTECLFRYGTKERFECFHWVFPMRFVDEKPLHELCRYWLLRFLVPNVDLVSNGSHADFFSAMKAEEPFECFNWVSHMCFVDNKPLPDFC